MGVKSATLTMATTPGWLNLFSATNTFPLRLSIVSSNATGKPVESQNLIMSSSYCTGS